VIDAAHRRPELTTTTITRLTMDGPGLVVLTRPAQWVVDRAQ